MDSSHQGGMVSEELQRGAVERTSGWRVVARWQRARCETPSLLMCNLYKTSHTRGRACPCVIRTRERPQSRIRNTRNRTSPRFRLPATWDTRGFYIGRDLRGSGSLSKASHRSQPISHCLLRCVQKYTPLVITRAQPLALYTPSENTGAAAPTHKSPLVPALARASTPPVSPLRLQSAQA